MKSSARDRRSLWRSRWAAIGAAVAVTVGSGGIFAALAAPSAPSSVVTIDPVRVLDTRLDVGLAGPFVSAVSQKLQVTGAVATVTGTQTAVPAGATGVLMNITVVGSTAAGFLSVRPGDATGTPSTSSVNFVAGAVTSNGVQVGVPTAGANAGKIEITYDAFGQAGPTTEVLVDIVGYTVAAAISGAVNYTKVDVPPTIVDVDTALASLVVNAPQAGHVVVNSSFNAFIAGGVSAKCDLATSVTTTGVFGIIQQIVGAVSYQGFALTEGFAVPAGPTTFYLVCKRDNAGADIPTRDANITAVYSPIKL